MVFIAVSFRYASNAWVCDQLLPTYRSEILGIPRGAFIRFQSASQLQYPFAEPTRDPVKGFQQTIVLCSFSRVLEKLNLNRFGFLPVADAHANESHWLARQFAVKKEFPGLS